MGLSYEERLQKLYSAISCGDAKTAMDILAGEKITFTSFMDNYIEEHGLKRVIILRRAAIPEQYGYKLLNGAKRTKKRNYILRICIAMEMNLENVNIAIQLYGMNPLNQVDERDQVIAAGITHRETVDTIEDWLCMLKLPPLMDELDK